MTDLKKLREVAGKATPGPWTATNDGSIAFGEVKQNTRSLVRIAKGGGWLFETCDPEFKRKADQKFIAAANPETVIALLDRIEKLEKVFNFVKDAQCECSISERQSGHLVGCWKPEFDQLSKEVNHE